MRNPVADELAGRGGDARVYDVDRPPRDLLPRLLQLARQVVVASLEGLLHFLKPQHLGAEAP